MKKRIVVLASGRGTNFEAIAQAIHNGTLNNAVLVGIICNRKEASVIVKARDYQIPTTIIDSNDFKNRSHFDREKFDDALLLQLQRLTPDLICLAGYQLILGPRIVHTYRQKILNIHPSLLPKFKGQHAQKQALEAQVSITGCTIHYVTDELDGGPILVQKEVQIYPNDSVQSLSQRILEIEHVAYVEAIRSLTYSDNGSRAVC